MLLLDMRLPDGDGTEVFHRAQQTNPQARVVLITGYSTELDRRIKEVIGAEVVLPKPFDVAELLATLERLLQERKGSSAHWSHGPPRRRDTGGG